MKHRFATIFIAAAMLVSAPAVVTAQEQKNPQALASEGVQKLIRAMEMMLLAIPQYAAPEINQNGDIIIRRKHPERRQREDTPKAEKRAKPI